MKIIYYILYEALFYVYHTVRSMSIVDKYTDYKRISRIKKGRRRIKTASSIDKTH